MIWHFCWWDDALALANNLSRQTGMRHAVRMEDGLWGVDLADVRSVVA